MEIKNMTPHTLNIHTHTGYVIDITPSGVVTRVATATEQTGEVMGIPTYSTTYGEVQDLPVACEGVILVVSGMVAAAVTGRADVFSPGDLVRNSEGQPIGCKGLKQVA